MRACDILPQVKETLALGRGKASQKRWNENVNRIPHACNVGFRFSHSRICEEKARFTGSLLCDGALGGWSWCNHSLLLFLFQCHEWRNHPDVAKMDYGVIDPETRRDTTPITP